MTHRTDSQLADAAGHVGYEWAMLLGARESDWHKLPLSKCSFQKLANDHARTEVVLLHARLLYEFLFGESHHQDDIRAVHFLEGNAAQEWERDRDNLKGRLCPTLANELRRLNKRLFHLSYDRANLDVGWDPDTIINELTEAFRCFYQRLSQSRRELFLNEISTRSTDRFPFTNGLGGSP